jgi:hypothetical protein
MKMTGGYTTGKDDADVDDVTAEASNASNILLIAVCIC